MSEEVGYQELFSKKYQAKKRLKKLGKGIKKGAKWLAPRAKKAGKVMAKGTKILVKETAKGVVKVAKSPKTKKVLKGIGKAMIPPPEKARRRPRKREPEMFGFEAPSLKAPSFDLDFKPPDVSLPSPDFFFGSPKQIRKIKRHKRKTKKRRHRKKRSKSRKKPRRRKIEIYMRR